MKPAYKRPEHHMPLKLKTVLQRHGITQTDLGAAVMQAIGEPMDKTAMNLLCNWAQWPKRTPAASIRQQIGDFLRAKGVPDDEIATAFDPDEEIGRRGPGKPLVAVPETPQSLETPEPDPFLLEPVMLTAQAKRHFKLMFNPFGADPQCAEDVYLGDEQRYVASVIVEGIQNARMIAVVGESGSGKSTLAQAVLGLLPSQGTLAVDGQAWQQPATRNTPANQALRRCVQVVFQDPFSALSPRLTVEEIVGEGLRVHAPQLDASARRHRVVQALAEVGLHSHQFPGLLQRYPHAFSGGQRQRLAIARALILQPQVLVLDEPTSALDARIQKQVLALLQQLQHERGLAYLLITHDMEVVRAMAHQVLVMKDGAVVESGSVDAVLDAPQHPYTQALVQAML